MVGWLSLATALVAWVLRWVEAGHLPLFGTYESGLSLALSVLISAAVFWTRGSGRRAAWPVSCVVAAIIVAQALRYDTTSYALTISERSRVVEIHAVLAWAAFALLASQLGFALHRLIARRADDAMDRRLAFTLRLAFLLHTAMLASGSLYKFMLFGSVWSFDPVETLGLVAWMAYGTLLHMHLLAGWEGRRLAAWSVALFAILFVSYRGIVYFPAWSTYHIFDVDLRIHLVEGVDSEEGP
jgi:ABC-type transport system involved in cytochrome c biogenesis permease subunit